MCVNMLNHVIYPLEKILKSITLCFEALKTPLHLWFLSAYSVPHGGLPHSSWAPSEKLLFFSILLYKRGENMEEGNQLTATAEGPGILGPTFLTSTPALLLVVTWAARPSSQVLSGLWGKMRKALSLEKNQPSILTWRL